MTRKLTMDLEQITVESFTLSRTAAYRGTVVANSVFKDDDSWYPSKEGTCACSVCHPTHYPCE